MPEFTYDELRELLPQKSGPFVTITMPLERAGSNEQQNTIRLKNALRAADDQVTALEVLSKEDRAAMFAPAHALLDDAGNYSQLFQRQGLALFISGDANAFRYYNVDVPLEEHVVVNLDRFYIKPLLPALTNNERFYVLTLSQKQVHFLEGSREGLRQIELANLPENMADALSFENDGRNEGVRSAGASGRSDSPGTSQGAGGMSGSFAGHGAGDDDNKQYIEQFFHLINAALHPMLKDQTAPLVVVGVENLHPLYRQANTYKHLTEEGIIGNPTGYDHRELLERAWPIVEPIFKQAQLDAAQRYGDLLHAKQASHTPIEVLQAAYMGQVDSLFVARGVEMWGTYDFDTNQLEVHTDQHPGDSDLLDLAATQTILNGGKVYAVPPEEMPGDQPSQPMIAAVYRYALESSDARH